MLKKIAPHKKILFILPNLNYGGAEKVVSFIADNLDKNIFDVQLIIIGFKLESQHALKNITPIYLNKKRVLFSMYALYKYIKKNKVDIVFGTMFHVNCVLGFLHIFLKKIKFIGREASVLSYSLQLEKHSNFKNILIKCLYKKLDLIVCQSQDMYDDFIHNFKIQKSKLIIINNPITIEKKEYKIGENKIPHFITIGRLSKEKGYERLLNILSKISYPFKYTIIGNGILKNELLELVNKLGLKDKIKFVEKTDNVISYLSGADFFLQGSYYEGFPNAALESCAVGTPVIAFNVPGGTKEIIENNINGILVNSELAFLDILEKIDALKKIYINKKVQEFTYIKFNKEKILNLYLDEFKS